MARSIEDSRGDDRLDAEAARWYALRDAGWAPVEQQAFERWLAADPRHAAVWREFDDSLRLLDTAQQSDVATAMVRELELRRQRRKWRGLTTAAAVTFAAAACAVMLFQAPASRSTPTKDPASIVVVSKPERRELSDGSVVELNRGAAIEVTFSSGRRDIRLLRGEAHFAVTPDADRPFVVNALGVEVRAVGTAFSVEAEAAAINVVVTHGRVAVERLAGTAVPPEAIPMDPVYADAGHRVSVPVASAPLVTPLPPEELERELAWRGPRLEFSGTPLTEAVAAFNRENQLQMRVDGRELSELRLSGVFRADNAEAFAGMLERYYGVRVERGANTATLRVAP